MRSVRLRERFGRWTVLERGKRHRHWRCQCDCGNVKEVLGNNLRYGLSRSCGCSRRHEQNPLRIEYRQEYRIWSELHRECREHGIPFYQPWCDHFSEFLAAVGAAPEHGRLVQIIPGTGIVPGNVRWISRTPNRHRRPIRYLVYHERRLPLREVAQRIGITPSYLYEMAHKHKVDHQQALEMVLARRRPH